MRFFHVVGVSDEIKINKFVGIEADSMPSTKKAATIALIEHLNASETTELDESTMLRVTEFIHGGDEELVTVASIVNDMSATRDQIQ